ncbi:MAG TPA: FAD-binding protein, partial [Dehalococcoidia bacterium]|nr:FAD-binding protein [Dehalococcoidia bacterium]
MERFDIVIIGSGVAGLSAALAAAPGARALIVSKDALEESNTRYAQGGIAAALSADDSADAHLEDTLAAGGGLVERGSAAVLTNEAHTAIEELVR